MVAISQVSENQEGQAKGSSVDSEIYRKPLSGVIGTRQPG